MSYGYITMRNQDGTQWATMMYGELQWVESKRQATVLHKAVFDEIEKTQEDSRKRDCPDNGFYGIYNLHFSPV